MLNVVFYSQCYAYDDRKICLESNFHGLGVITKNLTSHITNISQILIDIVVRSPETAV